MELLLSGLKVGFTPPTSVTVLVTTWPLLAVDVTTDVNTDRVLVVTPPRSVVIAAWDPVLEVEYQRLRRSSRES